jgi:UDP-N-acetylmuramoyl-L-alanyl-D-glutamate--2,6-diaminopimelate ligase
VNSKKLFDIISRSLIVRSRGSLDLEIENLAFDSRKVKKGSLFYAIKGELADGHQYIDKAVSNGAVAIICEKMPDASDDDSCTYIEVADVRNVLATSSNLFYNSPSSKLKLVGVTGTNGKTTIVTLLLQLFEKMEIKAGLISTVKYVYPGFVEDASHTTPDPIKLNYLLSKMVETDCQYAFMEVSSHALGQKRIEGIKFYGGVFSNLTHDHLDYHGSFKNYLNIKKSFFDGLDKNAFALYNEDDKNGPVMVQNCKANRISYGLYSLSDIKGKIHSNSIEGLHLKINEDEVFTRLVGKYNAYNLLAAYGVAIELGLEKDEILIGLSMLRGAEGRFELVRGEKKKVFGIVDYAHTPDALENILTTLNDLKISNSKIITVVGCGGNRDKEKRPKMALIAAHFSDQLVLTSDNPRNENPEDILDDMEKGLEKEKIEALRITDRKQAIKTAAALAREGDLILVAGKGHEKYQEINGVKTPFDDLEILKSILK